MKRNGFLLRGLFVALAGVFIVGGCTEDGIVNDGPQISFANDLSSTTLAKGVTEWEINATITATAKLDQVVLYEVTSEYEDQLGEAITDFTDKNSYNLKFTVSNVTENKVIKISATDKDNITNSKNFTINITPPDPIPAEDELLFWTGTLTAQLGAQNSSLGSAYATSTGTVYTKSPAKTNSDIIDFIYYYKEDGTTNAEIISPKYASDNGGVLGTSTWTNKNDTEFKKVSLTATEFDAIVKTDDSEVVSAAAGFTEHRVTDLVVNDVFAFKTVAGKLGLAKVTGLSGTIAGSISVEVKVQK